MDALSRSQVCNRWLIRIRLCKDADLRALGDLPLLVYKIVGRGRVAICTRPALGSGIGFINSPLSLGRLLQLIDDSLAAPRIMSV